MNFNNICVFDFETDGTNPKECQPVQLAAVMIDGRSMSIIEGSEFSSYMRPPEVDKEEYVESVMDTVRWHAGNYKCTAEQILATWDESPSQKDVWKDFMLYLDRYDSGTGRKSKFTKPIACGHNILRFDVPIAERLGEMCGTLDKGGELKCFHPRDKIDIMQMFFLWFENNKDVTSYSLDFMRKYFGLSGDNAHDALQDVRDTAAIVVRFMRLHRNTAKKIKFEGSFREETDI